MRYGFGGLLVMLVTTLLTGCAHTVARGGDTNLSLPDGWDAERTCVLVEDRRTGARWTHGGAFCAERLTPCSTFKVPHALIGLELGELDGRDHVETYDGSEVPYASWRRDHDLSSAMKHSVVWYFQRLARRIGEGRMKEALERLDYGSADVSSGLTTFWLGGSLTITAHEQLALMRRLYDGTLPFSRENQATVRTLIEQSRRDDEVFSGKTGSGAFEDGTSHLGWYVGALETPEASLVFVAVSEGEGWGGRRVRENVEELLVQQGWMKRE